MNISTHQYVLVLMNVNYCLHYVQIWIISILFMLNSLNSLSLIMVTKFCPESTFKSLLYLFSKRCNQRLCSTTRNCNISLFNVKLFHILFIFGFVIVYCVLLLCHHFYVFKVKGSTYVYTRKKQCLSKLIECNQTSLYKLNLFQMEVYIGDPPLWHPEYILKLNTHEVIAVSWSAASFKWIWYVYNIKLISIVTKFQKKKNINFHFFSFLCKKSILYYSLNFLVFFYSRKCCIVRWNDIIYKYLNLMIFNDIIAVY